MPLVNITTSRRTLCQSVGLINCQYPRVPVSRNTVIIVAKDTSRPDWVGNSGGTSGGLGETERDKFRLL